MKYYIYLPLDGYLREWFVNEMGGEPVELPRGSHERDVLETFIARLPEGKLPDMPGEGKVAIVIPEFKHKPPSRYHYLPPKARQALARAIYVRCRMQLWDEIHPLDKMGIEITRLIEAWMEKHGISFTERNWEALRQMYFRKRAVYREGNEGKKSKNR